MRNRAELERLWQHSPAGFSIIELAGTARIGQCRASTQLSDATRLVELYGATLASDQQTTDQQTTDQQTTDQQTTDQQTADQQTAAAQAARDRLLSLLGPAVVAHRAEPQHDPSAALTHDVEVRDLRCTGIGCTQPARKCDLDHPHRHPEGPTAVWNLSAKSRRCHLAKHHGWTVTHHPNGHTLWRSPLGHSCTRPGVWQAPPPIPRHLTLPPARPTPTDDHDPRPLDLPLWDDESPS